MHGDDPSPGCLQVNRNIAITLRFGRTLKRNKRTLRLMNKPKRSESSRRKFLKKAAAAVSASGPGRNRPTLCGHARQTEHDSKEAARERHLQKAGGAQA